MCVCVHVCMRQTCMRVLVVGDQLHLATQQLPVVTMATQALQGGVTTCAGPALSLQIFVGCKQHTHNTFFFPRAFSHSRQTATAIVLLPEKGRRAHRSDAEVPPGSGYPKRGGQKKGTP